MSDSFETADQSVAGAPGSPTTPGGAPEVQNRRVLWIGIAIALGMIAVAGFWWMGGDATVPDVTGMTQEAAAASLKAAGLEVGKTSTEATLAAAPGTVTQQMPLPGTSAREGESVDLQVASVPVVAVPDVVGKSGSEAEADLAVEGLRVGEVTPAYSDKDAAGTVLGQSPEAGDEVAVASVVALEISAGPKEGAVPDVEGLTSVDANDVLESAGFSVDEKKKESEEVEPGVVMDQSPDAGTVAQEGTTVTLTVSKGAPVAAEPAPPATEDEDADEPAVPEEPVAPEEDPSAEKPTPKPEPSLSEVPDVIGMRALEAIRALRGAKLQFAIEWGPSDDSILLVIEQNPSAGADVDPGTVVTVTIGLPSFLFDGAQVQPLPAEPPAAEPPAAEPPAVEQPGGGEGLGGAGETVTPTP